MSFLDLMAELLDRVDLEKSDVIQPRKLVFVCGGKASNNLKAPASMRELLLERAYAAGKVDELGGARVLLAERAVDAFAESSFDNLLDLEEYISAVVEAVILIVESPGSICELGAFVRTPEIREKLIVVMPGDLKVLRSFITLGAVRFLTQNHPAAQVLGFHWKSTAGKVSAPRYIIEEMLVDIPKAMHVVHSAHKTERFRSSRVGHKIYLTLAFCHMLRAAKLVELKYCFAKSGVVVDEITIKRCIDTLIVCGLVKSVEHGKLSYYVARVARVPFKFAFKKGTPGADRSILRWITRIVKEIEKETSFRVEMFEEHHV